MFLIIQQNVLHLRTRFQPLMALYRDMNPDVILFNSTGARVDAPVHIPGYYVMRKNLSNENNDGSLIAIKKQHRFKEIIFQSRIHAIEVMYHNVPFIVATAYLPPRYGTLPIIDLMNLANRQGPMVLVGDLNAYWGRYFNGTARSLQTLADRGLIRVIIPNKNTYIAGPGSSTPDIVVTNNKITHTYEINVGPLNLSDHRPVMVRWDIPVRRVQVHPRRVFNQTNWEAFREELLQHERLDLNNVATDDLDNVANTWTERIVTAINNHVPLRTTRTFAQPRPSRAAGKLHYKIQRLAEYLEIYPHLHRVLTPIITRFRNDLIDQLRMDIRTFHDNLFKSILAKKDYGRFWRLYKAYTKERTNTVATLKYENGNPVIEGDEVNAFRDHFSNQFRLTPEQNRQFNPIKELEVVNSLIVHRTTHYRYNRVNFDNIEHLNTNFNEVKKIIGNLPNKAPGPSGINKTVLIQCPDDYIKDLVELFRACLATSHFPSVFKKAIMIPIKKVGKTASVNNHRPISLLEIPGKIFERVVLTKLTHELEDHELLKDKQYGFRPFLGTEVPLALLYENIARQIKHRTLTITCRDVKGAFDKVWHNGLRYKINRAPLHISMKLLLSQYLYNREARIRYRNVLSQPFTLETGVPQGALLSPTLYNLYLSDLPDTPTIGRFQHTSDDFVYADDITQLIQSNTRKNSQGYMVRSMTNIINEFERDWKIETNPSKFQITPLSKKYPDHYMVKRGCNVSATDTCTVLGLQIDAKKGLLKQVESNRDRALTHLTKMLQFQNLSLKTKLLMYKTLVRSRLTYPSVILCALENKKHVQELQKVQNKALRKITNTHWREFKTAKTLHEECRVESINQFVHRVGSKVWFKIQELLPDRYMELNNMTIESMDNRFPSSMAKMNDVPDPIYVNYIDREGNLRN